MSKANRNIRRAANKELMEFIVQAHDRLHKDDVDACHEQLHAAMGSGEVVRDVAPLGHLSEFDAEFIELCVKHGVRSVHVTEDPRIEGRMISGGDAQLCMFVDHAIRAATMRP